MMIGDTIISPLLTEFLVSNLGQKMNTLTSMSRQVIKTASNSQPGYSQKLLRCNLLLNFKSVYKLIVGVGAYKFDINLGMVPPNKIG